MKCITKLLTILTLCLILISCIGGGNGVSNNSLNPTPPVPTYIFAGTVNTQTLS